MDERIHYMETKLEDIRVEFNILKEESLGANENLREAQMKLLMQLDKVQQFYDSLTKFIEQVYEQMNGSNVVLNILDELVYWHKHFSQAPSTLPRFSQRDKGNNQVLLSSWKSSCEEIKEIFQY